MEPKLALFKDHVTTALGVDLPRVETKHLLMAAIGLEGIGGLLFIFGNTMGAYLLLIFLASVTPIMHDFYNYDISSKEYTIEFINFLKNMSLFGALLFYVGMKNSIYKRSRRGKAKAS
ncbi:hypothetical protein KP509_33G048600 [Ceratopteris richardii]|nr:hypothetical protein KP509_33G048600 [Ceratopteris richardii]